MLRMIKHSPVQVRRAVEGDVPVLMGMVEAYWAVESIPGFDPARLAPALRALLREPTRGAGWIAEWDAGPIGYLLAVYVFSLEHAGLTAEIDEFYVVPDGRSVGVGSALYSAAEVEFMQLGCTNVSLQLGRGNEAARRFYRRLGFGPRSSFEMLEKTLDAAHQPNEDARGVS